MTVPFYLMIYYCLAPSASKRHWSAVTCWPGTLPVLPTSSVLSKCVWLSSDCLSLQLNIFASEVQMQISQQWYLCLSMLELSASHPGRAKGHHVPPVLFLSTNDVSVGTDEKTNLFSHKKKYLFIHI
jgi:hypothetical protein